MIIAFRNSSRLVILCLAVCLFFGRGLSAQEKNRTWTDSTGKHKMEGKYSGMSGSKVKLTLKTGKKVEIELKKLSAADQKYVASLADDNPFKDAGGEEEESPFESSDKGNEGDDEEMKNEPEEESSDDAGEDDEDRSSSQPRTFKVDWEDSEAILLEAPSEEWTATVAPFPAWQGKPKNVALPPKKDFFEKMTGSVVNQNAQKAIVSYQLDSRGNDASSTIVRLVPCDLKTGKAGTSAVEEAAMMAIALDDTGTKVAMQDNRWGAANLGEIEIWTLKGKKVQRTLNWKADKDVKFAEFIDSNHLLTASNNGKVALWDLKARKPEWHFEAHSGSVPCLSGDRKILAFCIQERVGLFDMEEKRVIAMAPMPAGLHWPQLAFSPSGTRLGCVAQNRVLVWDTTNGQLLYDFEAAGLIVHGGMGFPDENFIFVGDRYILELENQIKLWDYGGAEQLAVVGKQTFAAMGAHNASGALVAAELPHKEAKDLLEKALTQPDLFVFREGTKVKIDVSGVPTADQEHVREALTKKLTDMKCPVDDNGTISLVATVTGPKQRTISYTRSGDYTVQEYHTSLQFIYQGAIAWSSGSTNIPGFLMLKSGENIEGVLRKASERPDISFYDRVVLPKFLQKPTTGQGNHSQQTIGSSKFTTTGLK